MDTDIQTVQLSDCLVSRNPQPRRHKPKPVMGGVELCSRDKKAVGSVLRQALGSQTIDIIMKSLTSEASDLSPDLLALI